MRACFEEYYRVLKAWSLDDDSVQQLSECRVACHTRSAWNCGLRRRGVRTLDKQQGSYRQVTSTAVKQDLVISAYKPTEALAGRFALGGASPENAWAFVTEHLEHVPVFSSVERVAEVIAERTSQLLHDRMVAFHVQRQLSVPFRQRSF